MDIKYEIQFYSDWHCGSGLTAGADLDLLVIKDKNNLPFIPGKTMKGLIKEALEDLKQFSGSEIDLEKLLGRKGESIKKENVKAEDEIMDEERRVYDVKGSCFFKNAVLEEKLQKAIIENELQNHLYRTLASTAIEDTGVARAHSLRKIQVTVPCVLEGEILDVPEKDLKFIEDALGYIKRIGQNRNRGLGRCQIKVISTNEKKEGGKV